jgi:hypothetical protein
MLLRKYMGTLVLEIGWKDELETLNLNEGKSSNYFCMQLSEKWVWSNWSGTVEMFVKWKKKKEERKKNPLYNTIEATNMQ